MGHGPEGIAFRVFVMLRTLGLTQHNQCGLLSVSLQPYNEGRRIEKHECFAGEWQSP